jgi:hypothetical protein
MDRGTTSTFGKKKSTVLATVLALSVITNCALLAVLTWRSKAHKVELNAARAQLEKEREILTRMWQVTDDALRRERKKGAAGREIRTRE